jgi:predicted AAA+ superfamily ATPase
MLTSIYGKNTKLKILNGEKDVTKGAVYENVIAQELMAHGYKLYYLKNKKIGELDFVIEDKEEVLPIEVKSGKNYKIHSALSNVLTDDNLGINEGLVFAETNVQKIDKVTYLPLYMVMAIENAAAEFEDISLEKYIWK